MDFSPLTSELAHWRRTGRTPRFWWRDDDAVSPTPALDRLLALADRHTAPIALAVIPAHATDALADHLTGRPRVCVLTHGWSHENHASPGAKKCEFGKADAVAQESLTAAYRQIKRLFAAQAAPAFVPPWNRITPDLFPFLPSAGFNKLSTFGPRPRAMAAPGLTQINTHIDPIFWRGSRGLADPDELIALTSAHLAARRTGAADNGEPLGLLTHHLVHDEPIWDFADRFLSVLRDGGAEPVNPFTQVQ